MTTAQAQAVRILIRTEIWAAITEYAENTKGAVKNTQLAEKAYQQLLSVCEEDSDEDTKLL